MRVLNQNSADQSKIYADDNGRVFREIPEYCHEFLRNNHDSFLINNIDGRIASIKIADFHNGPSCWSSAQVEDYVAFGRNLYDALLKEDLYLWDGHPYNFMFHGPSLRFVDIGSVKTGKDTYGIFSREVGTYSVLNEFYRTSYASRLRQKIAESQPLDIEEILRLGFASLADADCYTPMTERFNRFRNGPSYKPKGRWIGYRPSMADLTNEASKDKRTEYLENIISANNITRVIDVGANDGMHAITCASNGCHVLAIDIEDHSVNEIYGISKKNNLSITSTVSTLSNYIQHLKYVDRVFWPSCDMVIFFAVIHHMIHDFGYSFEKIFEEISVFSPRVVMMEFVSYDDCYLIQRPNKIQSYNIDGLCKAAAALNYSVNILPPHEIGRNMIVATKNNT